MVKLSWIEGRKRTLFSRTFWTRTQASDWGRAELLPYNIGYVIEAQ